MAERVVIDASFALAFLMPESDSLRARAAVAAWELSGIDLLVPTHFWIEVANVLVRRRGMAVADAIEYLVDLDDLGLQTVDVDRSMLLLALAQMERAGLSAYDAIYLALAMSTDAGLATLDRRLAESAGAHGLLVDEDDFRRLSEEPGSYEPVRSDAPPWAHSAVVGAHIAELRRRALAAGS